MNIENRKYIFHMDSKGKEFAKRRTKRSQRQIHYILSSLDPVDALGYTR